MALVCIKCGNTWSLDQYLKAPERFGRFWYAINGCPCCLRGDAVRLDDGVRYLLRLMYMDCESLTEAASEENEQAALATIESMA